MINKETAMALIEKRNEKEVKFVLKKINKGVIRTAKGGSEFLWLTVYKYQLAQESIDVIINTVSELLGFKIEYKHHPTDYNSHGYWDQFVISVGNPTNSCGAHHEDV